MIVLDANILIRAVLGRRVRHILDSYTSQAVRFFAPDIVFDDARKHLPQLLKKHGKPHTDLPPVFKYLRNVTEPVDRGL